MNSEDSGENLKGKGLKFYRTRHYSSKGEPIAGGDGRRNLPQLTLGNLNLINISLSQTTDPQLDETSCTGLEKTKIEAGKPLRMSY